MAAPDYARRFAAAQAEMAAAGVKPRQANPVALRVLAKLGFQVTPPLYRGFVANTLSLGLFFGVFWGVLMYVLAWKNLGMPLSAVAILSGIAGLLFGVMMAGFMLWQRKRLRLRRWQDL